MTAKVVAIVTSSIIRVDDHIEAPSQPLDWCMKKSAPAPDPDAYVAALTGWQLATVKSLRKATLAASNKLVEVIKWGHIVYYAEGPVLLIRAEEQRVLFGFWRGKRLQKLDERLVAGGKYEMATMQLRKGDVVSADAARRLVRAAVRLNKTLGDPTALFVLS